MIDYDGMISLRFRRMREKFKYCFPIKIMDRLIRGYCKK